jgi:hypothetical protein
VLGRQPIDASKPHPFTQAGNSEFNAFLWVPPAGKRAGDILFVDSTHVLKTGSDVHFIIFHILPLLPEGVWIHFHDCMFPFEYPDKWIFVQNNSWNEIYMLRAFLAHNARYAVRYWSSLLSALYPEDQEAVVPGLNRRPGSGIWIEKIAPGCQ